MKKNFYYQFFFYFFIGLGYFLKSNACEDCIEKIYEEIEILMEKKQLKKKDIHKIQAYSDAIMIINEIHSNNRYYYFLAE